MHLHLTAHERLRLGWLHASGLLSGLSPHTQAQLSDHLLRQAIKKNDRAMATYLVRKGANVNHRNTADLSPLDCAAIYSSPEMIRTLVQLGANVNARSNNNMTALHFALLEIGDLKSAKNDNALALIKLGAHLHKPRDAILSKSPVEIALANNNQAFTKAVHELTSTPHSNLVKSAYRVRRIRRT